jgi:hypothetical protein
MSCFQRAARLRLAMDNRLNRDLIATARTQGFTFANPPLDSRIWEEVATADFDKSGLTCSPETANWLFAVAFDATLFQVQQARRAGIL